MTTSAAEATAEATEAAEVTVEPTAETTEHVPEMAHRQYLANVTSVVSDDEVYRSGRVLAPPPDQGDVTNGPQYFILLVLLNLLPESFFNVFLDIF